MSCGQLPSRKSALGEEDRSQDGRTVAAETSQESMAVPPWRTHKQWPFGLPTAVHLLARSLK